MKLFYRIYVILFGFLVSSNLSVSKLSQKDINGLIQSGLVRPENFQKLHELLKKDPLETNKDIREPHRSALLPLINRIYNLKHGRSISGEINYSNDLTTSVKPPIFRKPSIVFEKIIRENKKESVQKWQLDEYEGRTTIRAPATIENGVINREALTDGTAKNPADLFQLAKEKSRKDIFSQYYNKDSEQNKDTLHKSQSNNDKEKDKHIKSQIVSDIKSSSFIRGLKSNQERHERIQSHERTPGITQLKYESRETTLQPNSIKGITGYIYSEHKSNQEQGKTTQQPNFTKTRIGYIRREPSITTAHPGPGITSSSKRVANTLPPPSKVNSLSDMILSHGITHESPRASYNKGQPDSADFDAPTSSNPLRRYEKMKEVTTRKQDVSSLKERHPQMSSNYPYSTSVPRKEANVKLRGLGNDTPHDQVTKSVYLDQGSFQVDTLRLESTTRPQRNTIFGNLKRVSAIPRVNLVSREDITEPQSEPRTEELIKNSSDDVIPYNYIKGKNSRQNAEQPPIASDSGNIETTTTRAIRARIKTEETSSNTTIGGNKGLEGREDVHDQDRSDESVEQSNQLVIDLVPLHDRKMMRNLRVRIKDIKLEEKEEQENRVDVNIYDAKSDEVQANNEEVVLLEESGLGLNTIKRSENIKFKDIVSHAMYHFKIGHPNHINSSTNGHVRIIDRETAMKAAWEMKQLPYAQPKLRIFHDGFFKDVSVEEWNNELAHNFTGHRQLFLIHMHKGRSHYKGYDELDPKRIFLVHQNEDNGNLTDSKDESHNVIHPYGHHHSNDHQTTHVRGEGMKGQNMIFVISRVKSNTKKSTTTALPTIDITARSVRIAALTAQPTATTTTAAPNGTVNGTSSRTRSNPAPASRSSSRSSSRSGGRGGGGGGGGGYGDYDYHEEIMIVPDSYVHQHFGDILPPSPPMPRIRPRIRQPRLQPRMRRPMHQKPIIKGFNRRINYFKPLNNIPIKPHNPHAFASVMSNNLFRAPSSELSSIVSNMLYPLNSSPPSSQSNNHLLPQIHHFNANSFARSADTKIHAQNKRPNRPVIRKTKLRPINRRRGRKRLLRPGQKRKFGRKLNARRLKKPVLKTKRAKPIVIEI